METEPGTRSRPRAGWLLVGDCPVAAALGDLAAGACPPPVDAPDIDVAVDELRPRMVVVFAPPATAGEVALVAARRRTSPGLRAALVTPTSRIRERLHGLRLGYDAAFADTTAVPDLALRLRDLAERRPGVPRATTRRPRPAGRGGTACRMPGGADSRARLEPAGR